MLPVILGGQQGGALYLAVADSRLTALNLGRPLALRSAL